MGLIRCGDFLIAVDETTGMETTRFDLSKPFICPMCNSGGASTTYGQAVFKTPSRSNSAAVYTNMLNRSAEQARDGGGNGGGNGGATNFLPKTPLVMWWSRIATSTFDVLPAALPIPWTLPMRRKTNKLPKTKTQKDARTRTQNIRIAHVTLVDSIDGQSHVLKRTAVLLSNSSNKYDVMFVTSHPFKLGTNGALTNLLQHGIAVVYAPMVVDHALVSQHFSPVSSTSSISNMDDQSISMKALVNDLSSAVHNALQISSTSCLARLSISHRTLLGPLVHALLGVDVVSFTNVPSFRYRDSLISLAAKCARVTSVLVDPGNINMHLPTLVAVDGLLVPSNVAAAHWRHMLNAHGRTEMPIHVVQPGATVADPSRISSKLSLLSSVNVAFIGRLSQTKNPSVFLRVAQHVIRELKASPKLLHASYAARMMGRNRPVVQFVLVGDGVLSDVLKKMTVDMGLQDVVSFVGAVNHHDLLQSLSNGDYDMVVHPTLTNETFGLSNIEAMAAGVPLLTFGVGGVADYARNSSKHCLVVLEPTPKAMAKEVLRVLSAGPKYAVNLGKRGKQYLQDFGLLEQDMATRFGQIYTKMAATTTKTTTPASWIDKSYAGAALCHHALEMSHRCSQDDPARAFSASLPLWNLATRHFRGTPLNDLINSNIDDIAVVEEAALELLQYRREHILPAIILKGQQIWNELHSSNMDSMISQPTNIEMWPGEFNTRGNYYLTTRHKLQHDEQQLRFNVLHNLLPKIFLQVADNYTSVLQKLKHHKLHATIFLDSVHLKAIGTTYNQLTYLHQPPWPPKPPQPPQPPQLPIPMSLSSSIFSSNAALSTTTNFEEAEREYFSDENAPGIAIIDNVLSPAALHHLLLLLQSSTIWYDIKNGYLGAYHTSGLSSPIFSKIEEELRTNMPNIIGDLPLNQVWAYKCDTTSPEGLAIHADEALVNINLWLTPTEANLGVVSGENDDDDDGGGGLIVWLTKDEQLPTDWDFTALNHWDATNSMYDFVRRTESRKVVVPYRQNRATIFHSRLFHESAKFRFKEGYENARINLTFLFGSVSKKVQ